MLLIVGMFALASVQVTDVPISIEDKKVYLQAPVERQEAPGKIRREIETGCGPDAMGRAGFNYILHVSVKEACNIHDWQYALGGSEKDRAEADALMRKNMLQIIRSKRDILLPVRMFLADAYYLTVRSAGWLFYGRCTKMSCKKLKVEIKQRVKSRNLLAQWAWQNKCNAAGFHGPKGNKKREANKKACRNKVDY